MSAVPNTAALPTTDMTGVDAMSGEGVLAKL